MIEGKSFITIKIDTHELDKAAASLIRSVSASTRIKAITSGAKVARDEIQGYYTAKGRNLWINPALGTHGPGRKKTAFAKLIESGWQVASVNGTTVTISNGALGLAHKVTGGIISAKRAKFLTIPLIPQAHDRRAAQFAKDIGPLFAAKGVLMWKKPDGSITPAYALKKSVTHPPWPGALPPTDDYALPFMDAAADVIVEEITKS